ncbi:hypothetical protein PMAYCL1PPCAC_21509, partial [Pristionchus mayeri]
GLRSPISLIAAYGATRMGPSKTWLPTLLISSLLILLPHLHYSDAQIARTMRHWRHGEKGVCSGSSNMRADLSASSHDRFNDLRMIYQNCTRVFGNVEITHLNQTKIGNRTLDFLDDIEEVKGYIIIYKTELERISFKNLKIIWGDAAPDGGALMIEANTKLKVVSMPNLRSIDKGKISMQGTKKACHIHDKIIVEEILVNRSRLEWFKNDVEPVKTYCAKKKVACHPSCNDACWGPEEGDCQAIYRSGCPKSCESGQCYVDPETNQKACCNSQCVAGCTGPTSKDCNFCTNFMQCKDKDLPTQECRCVEQCTSRRKYNRQTGQLEDNPEGYYSVDNRHCEKECPAARLVQDDVCVEHCGPGMYYDVTKGDKMCRKCDGACPKICKFEAMLDAENIMQLQNCTEIEGHLRIQKETLTEHNHPIQFKNATNDTPARKMPAVTLAELEVLRTVKYISEYLYVAAADANLKSLHFLENLEFIEGRSLYQEKQSLIISKNDNLDHLGLRKLRRIEKGDVIITMNTDLCYMDTFNWTEIIGPNSTVMIKANRDKRVCQMENKKCHESCDPEFGCWGPTNADCRKCMHWLQEGRCVEKCSEKRFFENHELKTCDECYKECDTCTGKGETACLTCRDFRLYRVPAAVLSPIINDADDFPGDKPRSIMIEASTMGSHETTISSESRGNRTQLTCVGGDTCPKNYFLDGEKGKGGECVPCHESCYDNGCNGTSNHPGPNGCKQCKYALIERPQGNATVGAISRCLFNTDLLHANQVCDSNSLLDHFVQTTTHRDLVAEFECAPCDDECLACQSKGISRITNKCICKNFVAYGPWHKPVSGSNKRGQDARCVQSCDHLKGFFHDNETIEAGVKGVCRACSRMCVWDGEGPWCTGETNQDCINCAHFTYKHDDGTKTCVKDCMDELGLFAYSRDNTCNAVDLDKRDKIKNTIIYTLIALLIVLFLLAALFFWLRQKRLSKELEQEKVANNPEMPELIPMDLNGHKPNHEKFNLISKQCLSRSAKELGRGAFGVVYAGCWMPLTRNGKPTKVPVAIKVVRDPTGRAQSEMLDEAAKMTMLRHENLLRIVGVCLSADDLQLVTLLRPLGNLREFLQKHRGKLSGKELLQYSYQIASGMKYLSDQRVVHRDLAARNVLVKNIQHVEITDFGLAKLIDIGADSVQVGEGKVAFKWLALEALEKQVYNTATDVWAFGVTVWEILTYGESPYANMTPMATKEFLLDGHRLVQPPNCNIELYKYLIDCWLPNPDSRPTFAILKENFYKCCRAPWYFVNDSDKSSPFELDNCSQRLLIEEILDETDFEDPQNYFESEPNTPGCANIGNVFDPPMGIRRMDSLGSQRYAQDPTTRKEFGMDDGNYLVPNSHAAEIGATMYTPVVVDESGNSSLVESDGYYNEVKQGSDYVNDTQGVKKPLRSSRDDRLSMIEEDDDIIVEKESCL